MATDMEVYLSEYRSIRRGHPNWDYLDAAFAVVMRYPQVKWAGGLWSEFIRKVKAA